MRPQLPFELPRSGQWFATTHWSVVLSAVNSHSPQAESALEELCRNYWYPLYVYVRKRGYDVETGKELTQEFFAQLLAKKLLQGVDPAKGRFRSWLLGVMKHFLAHEWARAHARKRGGGQMLFSLDELEAESRYHLEPADESNPEKIFDRRWALTVLECAAAKLRQEYETAGKANLFCALKHFVSVHEPNLTYEDAAERLRLTVSAVKSAIHRLRERYQELIRQEIAQTVGSSSEIDEEIRYLLAILRS